VPGPLKTVFCQNENVGACGFVRSVEQHKITTNKENKKQKKKKKNTKKKTGHRIHPQGQIFPPSFFSARNSGTDGGALRLQTGRCGKPWSTPLYAKGGTHPKIEGLRGWPLSLQPVSIPALPKGFSLKLQRLKKDVHCSENGFRNCLPGVPSAIDSALVRGNRNATSLCAFLTQAE